MKTFASLLAALAMASTIALVLAEDKEVNPLQHQGFFKRHSFDEYASNKRVRSHAKLAHHHHPKVPHQHSTNSSADEYVPAYKRKSLHGHANGDTCHHFHTLKFPSKAAEQACKPRKHKMISKKKNETCEKDEDDEDDAKHASPDDNKSADLEKRGWGGYKLVKTFTGASFFDDMHFFTGGDPSGGMIEYVDHQTARAEGLIGLSPNGKAMMRIGHGRNGVQRSVRVSSQDTFTTGIFILDAWHMPTGCGVWPAFWTTPANPTGGWPHGGEIDVVEGVHYFSRNMYSIHAPSECSIPDGVNMLGELAMPNKALQRNCDPLKTDDQGCGIKSMSNGDYGHQYNVKRGGVHAMVWDSYKGIQMYFFPRGAIPSDIWNEQPNPATWGTPHADWPATHCNPDEYFREHVTVFTNTVCGTWAGSSGVWNTKQSGQDFTCAEKSKHGSCYEYMMAGPNLDTAFWEIESVKVYQKNRRH